MSEAIIVAVITGVCAVAAQWILSSRSKNDLIAKLDKQSEISDTKLRGEMAVMEEEISTLRREVQKHNSLIERTYKLEERVSVLEAAKHG